MILDSSAVVAILRNEPEAADFARIMDQADCLHMSAATYLELSIVIDSRRDAAMSR
jgi:ribonuclease VapC